LITFTSFKIAPLAVAAATLVLGCAAERNSEIVGSADDANITAKVKAALSQHPDLGPPNAIYVETRHHVVYLSGLVDNGLVTADAIELARQVPGVAKVESTVAVEH